MKSIFRLGTRGSPLALVQARLVADLIAKARFSASLPPVEIEIVTFKTTGDWHPSHGEKSFLDMGQSKGLFTKEIEEALLEKKIDLAVHSMKDVSVWTPEGLSFAALLEREDPRDALISLQKGGLKSLPHGARVGTASLRRKAQLLILRPDLQVSPLRGNVETRLHKLEEGEADATILAVAGLKRLGLLDRAAAILEPSEMLPAAAQGVLGIETRADDAETRALVAPLNHETTVAAASAERAVLRALDGSCRTPIAAWAKIEDNQLRLAALAAKPDGSVFVRDEAAGPVSEAERLGRECGEKIRAQLPDDFLI